MYPILFSFGSLTISSFSVLIVLAWIIFSFGFWKYLRSAAITEEKIFDLMFYTTLASLLAARLGYIIAVPAQFMASPLKMAAIWIAPGLSFYAGLLGGMITLLILGRRAKVRWGLLLDAIALSCPLAFAVGSLAGLLDGTEVGKLTTLAWKVFFAGHVGARHPVGLYEALVFVIIFLFIYGLSVQARKRDWPLGFLGIWFFLLMSIAMFAIEFVKEHSIYWRTLSANQWILILLFCQTAGAFYVRGGGRERLRPFLVKIYERIFRKHTV